MPQNRGGQVAVTGRGNKTAIVPETLTLLHVTASLISLITQPEKAASIPRPLHHRHLDPILQRLKKGEKGRAHEKGYSSRSKKGK